MKFLEGYRKIAAMALILVPQILAWAGYPIGGEDLAPTLTAGGDLIAAGLLLWSKLHPVDVPK